MYAVVKTGGKQHKVVVGETFSVELLDADAGAVVTLPALLVSDGENIITGEDAANATVTAEVLGHGKADKVIVFKFKKRKGYKRTRGHRQNLTLVKVTDIALAGAKKAPKAKAAEVAVVEAVEVKPAVKKPVVKKAAAVSAEAKPAVKKPAVKKAAAASAKAKPAVKKPAAKKPAAKKPAAKKTTKPAESAE
ncbi:MAG TPA: 50S ribosomal protein L21 [Coriobacteriia bacterium]